MLDTLYAQLNDSAPVAVVIISLSLMMILAFLTTRVTKLLRLPNVTAYIVTGILIGPFCMDLIPRRVIDGMAFLPDIALAFIAFSTGEFFRIDAIKKSGWGVILLTLSESLLASVLVFLAVYYALGLPLAFSIVLAVLAAATAPASTMMTIRQTGAKGPFVDTLLQVVALDDIVGLVAYSVAISIAVSATSGEAFAVGTVVEPLLKNLAAVALGAVFGFVMKGILTHRNTDNRLIVSIALLFAFCGACAAFGISPLLGCMAMGTVYINTTDDTRLFRQLGYFSPPILLLFFVRSGLSFDLGSLVSATGSIGRYPLLVVGIVYFVVRIAGKYGGAFLGAAATRKEESIRNYLGLALIPQAGVAIGLAALGARTLGGEMGKALETIILASSVLYELIGPACGKLSLYLSHSYSDKLEEVAQVSATDEKGEALSPVELLIRRIQAIQAELPEREVNENEQAFTEAAEEHFNNLQNMYRNQRHFFRR
ncbi:MAG: cation:proton antiporter [Oscillospiraceae bacterium]|nr:cation:proton antiporter [Oscillospiraceae bacterium]